MRIIRQDDLVSLAHGATFLGTGGGGTLSSTLEMIRRWFPNDAELRLVSVDQAAADDEALTTVASFIGSQAANQDLTDIRPAIAAVEAMSRLTGERLGKPVGRTIAVEIGVQSSAVPSLLVAAHLGLDAVDADGAGRAVPVLPATLFAAAGLPATPTILTNNAACTVVVEHDDAMVANLVAGGVVGSAPFGAVAGLALWPMDGATLARVIPPAGATRGSLSLAIDVGAALRRGSLDSALERIRAEELDTEVVFRGRLAARRTTVSDDHLIVSFEDPSGRRVTTYSISENLVLWDQGSGRPMVLAPDSLCYVTPDGGALSNTELPEIGSEVVLVAIEARPAMVDSAMIRKAFADYLEKVGYPSAYVPFRQLLAARDPNGS